MSVDGPSADYAKSYDAVVFDVLKVTPEEFAVSKTVSVEIDAFSGGKLRRTLVLRRLSRPVMMHSYSEQSWSFGTFPFGNNSSGPNRASSILTDKLSIVSDSSHHIPVAAMKGKILEEQRLLKTSLLTVVLYGV